jgi:hypothetical protein
MQCDTFLDNTIATLKVIGMVGKGGRLCVRKGQLCLEPDDGMQFVRRWIKGDSRDIVLLHLRNVINDAINISGSTVADWTKDIIIRELKTCISGLQNLQVTYSRDSILVSHLDVLGGRIQQHTGVTATDS